VKFISHLSDGGFGEALFAAGALLLFQANGALCLSINEGLAFESAGGNAGKGIEHAQEVEGIGLDGLAQSVGADFSDGLANEGGGDFVSALKNIDTLVLAGEVERELMTKSVFIEQAEFFEKILVTAGFPSAEAIFSEVPSVGTELSNDFAIGNGVEHQRVNAVADGLGQARDFAVARAGGDGIFDF